MEQSEKVVLSPLCKGRCQAVACRICIHVDLRQEWVWAHGPSIPTTLASREGQTMSWVQRVGLFPLEIRTTWCLPTVIPACSQAIDIPLIRDMDMTVMGSSTLTACHTVDMGCIPNSRVTSGLGKGCTALLLNGMRAKPTVCNTVASSLTCMASTVTQIVGPCKARSLIRTDVIAFTPVDRDFPSTA